MIMYMNFQFAAARKHKFLLIHGQRSKEDQRWRLNKSRVQRFISRIYQVVQISLTSIGGFPYRFHHHWILMNFVLGQHGGRSKPSLATGPQIVHLLETIICSDWSKDANRMYLYSLTTVGTVLAEIRHTMLTFDIRLVAFDHSEAEPIIYNAFFSSAGYLATSSLYSFVVLNWPQPFLIWNATDLCFWVWLRSTSVYSFCSLESDAHKCYVLLCWKIFQSTSRSMYGLTTEQDTVPVAVPWGLACFAPDTSDLSPWRCIFLILAFPREMLYSKNCSWIPWIPWIHCALLKHTWRLWVYTSPKKTPLFLSICNLETRY